MQLPFLAPYGIQPRPPEDEGREAGHCIARHLVQFEPWGRYKEASTAKARLNRAGAHGRRGNYSALS